MIVQKRIPTAELEVCTMLTDQQLHRPITSRPFGSIHLLLTSAVGPRSASIAKPLLERLWKGAGRSPLPALLLSCRPLTAGPWIFFFRFFNLGRLAPSKFTLVSSL